jgi:hypothetical protein
MATSGLRISWDMLAARSVQNCGALQLLLFSSAERWAVRSWIMAKAPRQVSPAGQALDLDGDMEAAGAGIGPLAAGHRRSPSSAAEQVGQAAAQLDLHGLPPHGRRERSRMRSAALLNQRTVPSSPTATMPVGMAVQQGLGQGLLDGDLLVEQRVLQHGGDVVGQRGEFLQVGALEGMPVTRWPMKSQPIRSPRARRG